VPTADALKALIKSKGKAVKMNTAVNAALLNLNR
jgi:hypothetical protein